MSNAAFPARSAAEIREAILKAFAFGERGPPSSIGRGLSREKPSLLLLLLPPRFPAAQKAGEASAQWTRTCAKMGFSTSRRRRLRGYGTAGRSDPRFIPTATAARRAARRGSRSPGEAPNTSRRQKSPSAGRTGRTGRTERTERTERTGRERESFPGGVVSSESCLEEKLLLLRECQK